MIESRISYDQANRIFGQADFAMRNAMHDQDDKDYDFTMSVWRDDPDVEFWRQRFVLAYKGRTVLEFTVSLEWTAVEVLAMWCVFTPKRPHLASTYGVGPWGQEFRNMRKFMARYFENGTWWEQ